MGLEVVSDLLLGGHELGSDLGGAVPALLGNREDIDLNGGQPHRELACIVLDYNAHEPLHGPATPLFLVNLDAT